MSHGYEDMPPSFTISEKQIFSLGAGQGRNEPSGFLNGVDSRMIVSLVWNMMIGQELIDIHGRRRKTNIPELSNKETIVFVVR